MFKEKTSIEVENYLCERMIHLLDLGLIKESDSLRKEFHLDDSELFE